MVREEGRREKRTERREERRKGARRGEQGVGGRREDGLIAV